jgi:serine/threonine protein kinase/tetratricopeptide (TPR) repeat protein
MGASEGDAFRGLTPRSDDAWDRFEAAWDRGERPRIEDYLVGFEAEERRALLAALLASEIEHRRRRGEHPDAGEYRQRFPGEAAVIEAAFAAEPADSPGAAPSTEDHPTGPPRGRIGPYRLLQPIGEGGMGAVFMAEQEAPVRRRVALKVIRPGQDTAQFIARFEAERQALALMDHPHIAKVLDAGATDTGRPYFVMELVKGVPITEYCDRHRLSPRQRLELFIPVCQAVQHAHQKGIIHRDLKPSNVLVTLADGQPVAKVIDFGLAKAIDQRLTERTLFTQFGQIMGTLEYMSPEQAEVGALDVDTRSDIYSLGVLLYELLTGSTPLERAQLRQAGYAEILRRIREEEAPRPSTRLSESREALAAIAARRQTEPARLARLVRGELDWIAMKALEKDRTRRYETANGLARDIRRYLDGDPVEAGPPSATYRMGKFARKHRTALATVATFTGLLVAGVLVSTVLAVRTRQALIRVREEQGKTRAALDQVKTERDNVKKEQEKTEGALAQFKTERDKVQDMLKFLLGTFKTADAFGFEGLYFRGSDEPGREMTAAKILTRGEEAARSVFRDRPLLLAQLVEATGHVYRSWGDYTRARKLLEEALRLRQEAGASPLEIAISLRGVGRCHHDQGNYEKAERDYTEALDIQRQQHLDEHDPAITSTKFELAWLAAERRDPSGETLVREVLDERIRQFGARHREVALIRLGLAMLLNDQKRYPEALAQCLQAGAAMDQELVSAFMNGILAMQYRSRRQHELSAASIDKATKILSKHLGNRHPYVGLMLDISAFDLSAMGRRADAEQRWRECLAIARGTVGLGHPIAIEPVRYLARLLAESADRPQGKEEGESLWRELLDARVDRFGPRHPLATEVRLGLALFLEDHGGPGRAIEARRLFEQANPQLMMDKDADPRFPVQVHYGGREEGEVPDSIHPMTAFSPDGRLYVSAGDRPTARLYDRSRGVCVQELPLPGTRIESAAFTPDGQGLVTAGRDGTLQLWPVVAAPMVRVGPMRRLASTGGPVPGLAVAPGGGRVLTCGTDGVIRIWELETGRPLGERRGRPGACYGSFSADGEQILAGYSNGEVRLWSVTGPDDVRVFSKHEGPVIGCSFLAGDRQFISWAEDGNVRVWDVENRQPIQSRFEGHIRDGLGVAISADGRWILSAHADETLLLRERISGREVQKYELRLPYLRYLKSWGNPRGVGISFSPDGRYAACAGFRGLVYLVQLPP